MKLYLIAILGMCVVALGRERSLDSRVVGTWLGSIPRAAVYPGQSKDEYISLTFTLNSDGTLELRAGERKLTGSYEVDLRKTPGTLIVNYDQVAGGIIRVVLPDSETLRLENIVLFADNPKTSVLTLKRAK